MRKGLIIIFLVLVFSKPVFAIQQSVNTICDIMSLFNQVVESMNKDSVYLVNLEPKYVTSDIKDINDITIKGMEYKNGIIFGGDTTITYDLAGRYKHFTSYVALCDDVPPELVDEDINGVNLKMRKPLGRVQFSIFVDDVLVYFSSVINTDTLPEYISIDVANKNKLVIVVKNINESLVNAVIMDPILYKNDILHKPQKIEYKRDPGTFLYCNNPESITNKDTLDNNKIIYKAKDVLGNNCFFAEQNNSTGDVMYYGVLLKNNTDNKANVIIHNKGMSLNGWTGLNQNENCWRDFSKEIEETFTILPNDAMWLVEPANVPCYNQYTGSGVINLAINFTTDTSLELKVLAFSDEYKIDSPNEVEGEYEGYITKHSYLWGEARNYKGRTANYPKQECTLEWEIDNNTKAGYLPVRYNNLNKAGWITHITKNKHTSALEKDMYEFVDPNGICFSYGNEDYSTMIANLGNWAITYKETIKIKNNSDRVRSLDIFFKNAFLNSGVIIISKDGEIIKSFNEDKKIIKTLELIPNDVTSYTLEYILPACSVGGLAHYIKLN